MRLGLRLRRVIAIIGVAHDAIAHAQREKCLRQIGRQRNDAAHRLRHVDRAARLVGHQQTEMPRLPQGRRLRVRRARNGQRPGDNPSPSATRCCARRQVTSSCGHADPHDPLHPTVPGTAASDGNKKAPRREWGSPPHTLSREECQPAAAWAGVLTYGLEGPITVAGPWPIFTAFPLLPSLQVVEASLFCRSTECQPRIKRGLRPTRKAVVLAGKHLYDRDDRKAARCRKILEKVFRDNSLRGDAIRGTRRPSLRCELSRSVRSRRRRRRVGCRLPSAFQCAQPFRWPG